MAIQDVPRRADDREHAQAEQAERFRVLLEESSTLLASLRVEAILPEVLVLAQRTLSADAYALWRHDEATGRWELTLSSGLSDAYLAGASAAVSAYSERRSFAEPLAIEDVTTSELLTDEHRRAHAAEGTRSLLAVPMLYGTSLIGTISFYYRDPRSFTVEEQGAASLLANLGAAAIRTAELYQAQRALADDRRFVAEASELLASSLEYETTLANVARLAVPLFADWCSIDIVREDGSIGRLAVAHVDPGKIRLAEELAARFPPDPAARFGVPNVVRTGQSELFAEIPDELLLEATSDTPELYEILGELGLRSSMCVPLIARGRTYGAITFVAAESGRRYTEADLATAEDVARRAAVAVDNADLYRIAETARAHAQESLAVVDALFGATPVGIALMDTAFNYVRVNETLAAFNGLPADDHVGRSLRDVLGDLADAIEPYHRSVLETGEPVLDLEVGGHSAQSPDELRAWLVSYYPVKSAAGETLGVGVVITDVTEQQRARAEATAASSQLAILAQAGEQLASTLDYERTLANLATLLVPRFADWYAVNVLDEDGLLRQLALAHGDPAKARWVDEARALGPLGPGTGEDGVLSSGEAVLHASVTGDLLKKWARTPEEAALLRRLGTSSAMVVPLTAGGRTFGTLLLVSSNPERSYDADDLAFARHLSRRVAVAVDNARLYRAAEARAHSALVVEHVGDGVFLVDESGVIRLWNPAAESITGLSALEVVGRPAVDVLDSWTTLEELSRNGDQRPSTCAVEIRGNELWLSVTGVGFEGGSVYAFRDLTAERAVDRLKSDFVSTISHELRTPLAAIYGSALTLLRRDVSLGEPEQTGLLEVIANESDRLARIVNDILWASRIESGGMTLNVDTCDGVGLARGVVDAAHGYAADGITVELKAPDGALLIAADPDKVRQVLTNLVDNAVKFSPKDGMVEVDVGVVGRRLRFSVTDQGLGIPAAERERIFEKFYRVDPEQTGGIGGTGLGLYISRELLERMDGRIWVESSRTGGSTFIAELPLADRAVR
ncbi:MAG TPA: GAF domain-containing protein [Gaiellaceae bacterium]